MSVIDKLASKKNPTNEEQKYAQVLMTLIEAYEEEHHPIPDASPVEVLRALMEANDLRQKDLASIFGRNRAVSDCAAVVPLQTFCGTTSVQLKRERNGLSGP